MERLTVWMGHRSYLFFASVIIMLAVGFFSLYENNQAKALIAQRYNNEAEEMGHIFQRSLSDKQKVTTALALTLAQSSDAEPLLDDPKFARSFFDTYAHSMREWTPYQNIWIELVDPSGRSVYRSWTREANATAVPIPGERGDRIAEGVFVNRSDLLIATSVPLGKQGRLRMLTHFNSIAKALAQEAIEMNLFVVPSLSKKITEPFGTHWAGGYYIGLLDPPEGRVGALQSENIQRLCHARSPVEEAGKLFVSKRLFDANGVQVGCAVLAKNVTKIAVDDILLFTWRNVVVFASAGMVILVLLVSALLSAIRRQRRYYKEILDTSSNIVVVTDGRNIIDVNKTFFTYFDRFDTLEAFRREHGCICDLFVEEEGFIRPQMGEKNWVDYLLEHPEKRHLAKIDYKNMTYIFRVQASRLLHTSPHRVSVIFTDITREWEHERELEHISVTDPLTGIYNRRFFDDFFNKELARSKRYGTPLSLILIDIDFFKQVNDRLGHETGDEVLRCISLFVQEQIRETDRFCRVGGEEFAIVLPHTTADDAAVFAERLRRGVERNFAGTDGGLTISLGVHQCLPEEDAKTAYGAADDALYAAKNSGRNCVRVG